jgi:branched-chain amino acid transport system substrate-binding protein
MDHIGAHPTVWDAILTASRNDPEGARCVSKRGTAWQSGRASAVVLVVAAGKARRRRRRTCLLCACRTTDRTGLMGSERNRMNRRIKVLGVVAVAALAGAGCTGSTPTASDRTLIIGVDLPFQGPAEDVSDSTWDAMQLYLEQIGGRIGNYKVELKKYDNSTAAAGAWDPAQCTQNANDHVANADEVAVMGTFNTGCSKIQVPILNTAAGGEMLMVSHANTVPGLTKEWEPGEPDKYFPTGKRSYARVVTTDDVQGSASAQFAALDLKVSKCFVIDDTETYGKGVADAFAAEAQKQAISIVGRTSWNKGDSNYITLFGAAKAAGADCVFVGGFYDNNGGQLTKDKVAVLGDNNLVKLIAPAGFVGYPDFVALPQAAGAYLTVTGLPTDVIKESGGVPAKFLTDYKARYGTDATSSYALYGVQALQVILAAIEKSDGTRTGVRNAVFEGSAISIPADKAILGKTIAIEPVTGDVNAKDITIEIVQDRKETVVKAWAVT